MSTYIDLCLSTCLPAFMYFCLSACLSAFMSVCLHVYTLSICMSISLLYVCQSACTSLSLSFWSLFLCLSLCMHVGLCPSACLSLCLFVYLNSCMPLPLCVPDLPLIFLIYLFISVSYIFLDPFHTPLLILSLSVSLTHLHPTIAISLPLICCLSRDLSLSPTHLPSLSLNLSLSVNISAAVIQMMHGFQTDSSPVLIKAMLWQPIMHPIPLPIFGVVSAETTVTGLYYHTQSVTWRHGNPACVYIFMS